MAEQHEDELTKGLRETLASDADAKARGACTHCGEPLEHGRVGTCSACRDDAFDEAARARLAGALDALPSEARRDVGRTHPQDVAMELMALTGGRDLGFTNDAVSDEARAALVSVALVCGPDLNGDEGALILDAVVVVVDEAFDRWAKDDES